MPFGIPVPSNQLFQTGSSLTIEELSAPSGKKPRVLVLLGGALPFKGAEWGSKLSMTTKWYPGNPTEATQQVLVAQESPSAWEGVWRRTVMGKVPSQLTDETGQTIQIFEPHVLREVLEDIHRTASRLRVTWAVSGFSVVGNPGPESLASGGGVGRREDIRIVREGRISEFTTPVDTHTDIRWRMTFEWISRGGSSDRVSKGRNDEDISSLSNALQSSVNALSSATQIKMFSVRPDVLKAPDRFTLGQLESIANAPLKAVQGLQQNLQRVVSDFKRLGTIAGKFRALPFTIANQALDFARNTLAVVNQFLDVMGRNPPELYSTKSKANDVIRASKSMNQIVEASRGTAAAAQALQEAIRRTLVSGANRGQLSSDQTANVRAGDLLAVYVCKVGDTPQSVSRKFYGTADRGIDLLRANRMPWYTPTFKIGQVLSVPALTNRSNGV